MKLTWREESKAVFVPLAERVAFNGFFVGVSLLAGKERVEGRHLNGQLTVLCFLHGGIDSAEEKALLNAARLRYAEFFEQE